MLFSKDIQRERKHEKALELFEKNTLVSKGLRGKISESINSAILELEKDFNNSKKRRKGDKK